MMTVEIDLTNDFIEVVDGTESVTLLRRGVMPGSTGTVVGHALRRVTSVREASTHNAYNTSKQVPGGGRHTASEVTWHLPVAELPESPDLGDVILDGAARRWTILEVCRATVGSRWQCVGRDVALVYGLDDTVNILKATYIKGECGAAEPIWRPWRTGVRARIQPAGVTLSTEAPARRVEGRYQIFVAEDLTLDQSHRVQAPDGAVYDIARVLGAERIGEVQSIDARVVR